MSIEAMRQALEALEEWEKSMSKGALEAHRILRTAIEAAKRQEPVAWMFQHDETGRMNYVSNDGVHNPSTFLEMNPRYALVCPLYTTPPAAPVQEPVAKYIGECFDGSLVHLYEDVKKGMNFYTTPPAAQRQPLTDEQRQELMSKAWNKWLSGKDDGRLFAWYFSFEVEAAHGIKENT